MKTIQDGLQRAGLAVPEKARKKFFFLQEPIAAYFEEVRERAELVRRSRSIKAKIRPQKMKNGRITFMEKDDIEIMNDISYRILDALQAQKSATSRVISEIVGTGKWIVSRFLGKVASNGLIEEIACPGKSNVYSWISPLTPLEIYKQHSELIRKVEDLPEKPPLLSSTVEKGLLGSYNININVLGQLDVVFRFEVGGR